MKKRTRNLKSKKHRHKHLTSKNNRDDIALRRTKKKLRRSMREKQGNEGKNKDDNSNLPQTEDRMTLDLLFKFGLASG